MKGAVAKTNKEYKPLFESIIDYTYSAVRDNVTGEIVFDHGDVFRLIEQGII